MKDETLIRGEDLFSNGTYRTFRLTIKSVETVTREDKGGVKTGLLIHFEKASKPLFCPNEKLNYRMLKAELGTVDPDQLVGQPVSLMPVKGDWFGEKNTLAIRVLVTGDKPRPRVGREAFGVSVDGFKVGRVSTESGGDE